MGISAVKGWWVAIAGLCCLFVWGCAGLGTNAGFGNRGAAKVHVVRSGETLSEIAMTYYGTYKKFGTLEALKSANNIRDAQEIRVGQRLRIPSVRVDGRWMPRGSRPAAPRPAATATRPEPAPATVAPPSNGDHARGLEALREEDYDRAVSALDRARRADPNDSQVRRDLATARYQQAVRNYAADDLVAARAEFERVLVLRPDCQECRAYLGEIDERAEELLETGRKRYEAGRFEQAASTLERAVRLSPGRQPALEYRFRAYFELALERFVRFQDSGRTSDRTAAEAARTSARRAGRNCGPCQDYAESVKKRLYNDGIRRFTEQGSEQMEKAIRVWEQVRFVDPNYRDVAENIQQAEGLLKKLREI
jgi:tetratricopeptide (TPR) repeat protein